jgi:hypothetical protein
MTNDVAKLGPINLTRDQVVEAGIDANRTPPGFSWSEAAGFQEFLREGNRIMGAPAVDAVQAPKDDWHHEVGCDCKFCRQI